MGSDISERVGGGEILALDPRGQMSEGDSWTPLHPVAQLEGQQTGFWLSCKAGHRQGPPA